MVCFNFSYIILIVVLLISLFSCNGKVLTPYAAIETETDSQVFAYTDADVTINDKGTKSDDTTFIIVGVKDNTGANLESIFNHAMTQIKYVFEARQRVYSDWVKRNE